MPASSKSKSWIVTLRPVGPVLTGHLNETRRALLGQDQAAPAADADDATLVAALWATRALPVALDALADQRSGLALNEVRLKARELTVHATDTVNRGTPPLTAVALHQPGSDRVDVRFLPRAPRGQTPATDAQSVARISFDIEAVKAGSVRIQRWSSGGRN
jgi:hypothetical protein